MKSDSDTVHNAFKECFIYKSAFCLGFPVASLQVPYNCIYDKFTALSTL